MSTKSGAHHYVVGMAAIHHIGVRLRYIMKSELFVGPFAYLFRWLGGIPVDRSGRTDVIENTVNWIKNTDNAWLAMAPEGTRRKVQSWKTGFLRIAEDADIPIFIVGIDGSKKQIILDGTIRVEEIEGTRRADKAQTLRAYVNANFTGIKPLNQ